MKIMHIADIHVESVYLKAGKEKSKLLRDESVQHFAEIVGEANKQKVDAVLLCGDLFDKTIVRKSTVKFVLDQIAQNPGIKFFYCLGNHDHKLLFEGDLPQNLIVFPTNFKKYDLGEVVIGGSSVQKYSHASFTQQVDFDENRVNIFMLHAYLTSANVEGCLCFEIKQLRHKNIDYLALGHIHDRLNGAIDERGEWVYSGNAGAYGFEWWHSSLSYVLIEVKDGKLTWQRKDLNSARRFLSLEVDISSCASFIDIENLIKQKLKNAKSTDLVQVVLTGAVDEELDKKPEMILQKFSSDFFYFELKDRTSIKLDIQKIKKETLSLKAEFVNLVSDSNLTDPQKQECIKVGIAALRGEEVSL